MSKLTEHPKSPEMPTYLLTWNPTLWPKKPADVQTMGDLISKTKKGERAELHWNTGRNDKVEIGDRVYLVRQKSERGIVGSGFVTQRLGKRAHFDQPEKKPSSVMVQWDVVVDVANRLPIEALHQSILDVAWWNSLRESGRRIPDEWTEQLEQLWRIHLEQKGQMPSRKGFTRSEILPNEVRNPRRLIEGTIKRISVNAYERNREATRICKAHYKAVCDVCKFDFAIFYGELGEGYIHVHHLRDLATIGEEYEVDPIEDLRPVCPNCHAMLHRTTPALTIEALRRIIREQSRE